SRSSSPLALSASSRPRVATTLWRGLPSTRWLSTTWRYSKPPGRLVRKYIPASVCQHENRMFFRVVKPSTCLCWHYETGQFKVLQRQSAAFSPVLTHQLSKSHLTSRAQPGPQYTWPRSQRQQTRTCRRHRPQRKNRQDGLDTQPDLHTSSCSDMAPDPKPLIFYFKVARTTQFRL